MITRFTGHAEEFHEDRGARTSILAGGNLRETGYVETGEGRNSSRSHCARDGHQFESHQLHHSVRESPSSIVPAPGMPPMLLSHTMGGDRACFGELAERSIAAARFIIGFAAGQVTPNAAKLRGSTTALMRNESGKPPRSPPS